MIITGERFVPVEMDIPTITYEHWHRYYMANEFVKDKIVLDIACGAGYGTKFLSANAKYCIGIDIAQESIDYAVKHFSADNVKFKQGSITEIPLEDKSVDIIISFETIEHVDEKAQIIALNEYKRVLKDDGILLISSPNIDCWDYFPNNPYHFKEFVTVEFIEFLKNNFKHVTYVGQEVKASSTMYYNESKQADMYSSNFAKMGESIYPDKNKENYVIAACSNKCEIELNNSVLVDSENTFMKRLKEERATILQPRKKRLLSFNIGKKKKIRIYKEYID